MNLYEEFDRVVAAFEEAGLHYALVGGLAVGMHGFLRATKDMDFLLHPDDLAATLGVMKALGYLQNSEPWTFKDTQLTLWRFLKPVPEPGDAVVVDVLVPKTTRHQEMIERSELYPMGDVRVAVVSRADLIDLKMDRGAAQDVADIENLEAVDGREQANS
ncbi:MAG: hypothetical protein HN742_17865 [Lentisphaerae bacterium]|jgi:hypothetical protein|nr:hypothetical protein [Lentisphaerota bacterium]MBT4815035.1 hypothetical protein [Lentisphaerota bacterium]MBT5613022.1 hypothetical protein [Lentisphaerota bacterium]MBT7056732.1 hypothetical protein [Lentisphaerota bacterium]MBT7843750.1 hypothetical protein [Lentisphaerota bacterium]